MTLKKLFGLTTLLALMGAAYAQNVPGKDRPIRVAMFKGTGTGGRYWHTNIHTSHQVLAGILANPANAGLGDSLEVPPAGFSFHTMKVDEGNQGPDGDECVNNGCGPTIQQIAGFVSMLDTMDVMILSSVVDFGSRVENDAQRNAIANFWTNKGYVAIHAITDTYGTWDPLDTIHGARFRGHPAEQNGTIGIDPVFQSEPSWQFLNQGLFSGGATDTTFFEEWFYFTTSAEDIRSNPLLKPTTQLDEESIENPGSQQAMGDHPHSWYKQLPTGGRMFYTAVGHRAQVWQTTRMFRRQVYNAIMWTAKWDSLSNVTSIRFDKAAGRASDYSRLAVSQGVLTVSLIPAGNHTVELLGVDGRRVAFRKGTGADSYNFTGLRPGVYAVAVSTPAGRSSRLVTVQ